jgi:hypothetical protein
MIITGKDGSLVQEISLPSLLQRTPLGYAAEVPARLLAQQRSLIDGLIDLAFDTLGAHHLEVLVYEDAN